MVQSVGKDSRPSVLLLASTGDQGVDPRVIREVKIDNGHLYQWKLAAILRLQRIAPRNSHLASFQYHWHYLEVY